MSKKRITAKRIIVLAIIAIIVASGLIIGSLFLFGKKDKSYRIVRLGAQEITTAKPSSYSKSRLNLYDNGTFDVEIIYFDSTDYIRHFTGIGTYQKTKQNNKDAYRFIYTDAYAPLNGTMTKNLDYIGIDAPLGPFIYQITNDRILFRFGSNAYYFGR